MSEEQAKESPDRLNEGTARLGRPLRFLFDWLAKWLPLLSICTYGLVYSGYVAFYDRFDTSPELAGLTPGAMVGRAAIGLIFVLCMSFAVMGLILLLFSPARSEHMSTFGILALLFLVLGYLAKLLPLPMLPKGVLILTFVAWFVGASARAYGLIDSHTYNRWSSQTRRWIRHAAKTLGRQSGEIEAGLSRVARFRLRRGRWARRVEHRWQRGAAMIRDHTQRHGSAMPTVLGVLSLALLTALLISVTLTVGDDAGRRVAEGGRPFVADSMPDVLLAIVFDFDSQPVKLTWLSNKAPYKVSDRLVYLGEANGMVALYDVVEKAPVRIPAGQVILTPVEHQ